MIITPYPPPNFEPEPILKDMAVCRRALMAGGIVWRLTMESDVDLQTCCETHANEAVYQTLVVEAGRAEWVVPTLPDSVADTIVGMYKLYTGKLSFRSVSCIYAHQTSRKWRSNG